jgi:uncharacterized protein YjbI with pentapeptide repeats
MSSVTRLAGDVAAKIWPVITTRFQQSWQWLSLRPKVVFWAGGLSIALAFLVFSGPTAAGAALLAWAALRQAATASDRHQEQTHADRQRRITESFGKAIEQLGSDKEEVRLGGIYALERISRESPTDHWPVMATLTAFVRNRARWKEGAEEKREPLTDIAAVLTVITQRVKCDRRREAKMRRRLDLQGTDLRGVHLEDGAHLEDGNLSGVHLEHADLKGAHLEHANLSSAHLERANLSNAHLEGADLRGAHMEHADLGETHLERTDLREAHLKRTDLRQAHLEGANLRGTYLEGANLREAHLEGADLGAAHMEYADLSGTHLEGAYLHAAHLEGADLVEAHLEGTVLGGADGLTQAQIDRTFGDAKTVLPAGLIRPSHWLEPKGSAPAA